MTRKNLGHTKKKAVLKFLILGFLSDNIFGPKKDKRFCPVFSFRRCMLNAIFNLVLFPQSEG